jgi:hypothetical protein
MNQKIEELLKLGENRHGIKTKVYSEVFQDKLVFRIFTGN